MKSVFTYIDYRLYLRDYYAEKKRTTRHFSHRYFMNKAGISSPNVLKRIMEGSRNLTPSTCEKFCRAIGFSDKEKAFFSHLVLFNQSRNADEKQEHYRVLLSMMNHVRETVLSVNFCEYYRQWYNSVIRELICLADFGNDYKAIAAAVQPPIKSREAKAAVKLLLRLKMIVKDKSGRYHQNDPAILSKSDNPLTKQAVRDYNRQMILRGEEAIDTVSPDQRQIYGLSIGVSKPCYDVIAAEMRAFRDRIVAIVNNDGKSDRVYQLGLQLFPTSRAVKENPEADSNKEHTREVNKDE